METTSMEFFGIMGWIIAPPFDTTMNKFLFDSHGDWICGGRTDVHVFALMMRGGRRVQAAHGNGNVCRFGRHRRT